MDFVFATTDESITPSSTTGADTLSLLEEPHAHLEPEIVRGKRTHRADIGRVQTIIVGQLLARMRGQHSVTAAIGETKHIIVRNLLTETDATGAHDATLVVQPNPRADVDILRLFDFVLTKS